ncbi:uncharacterized protein LOC113307241 [Papaver somniferum]|uniref:uncharacterized protein LOC113307241 n=1 Tax=Papaver somniferum TaxID=3469 RepID=UPI000E7058D8|nr:uncharacterized protein LOC113307241 [Papaver somniferum]
MMVNPINSSYHQSSSSSKLDEIMSRYRPIAPKPILDQTDATTTAAANASRSLQISNKRVRKRGRYGLSSSAARKRTKTTTPTQLHGPSTTTTSSSYGMGFNTRLLFSPPPHEAAPLQIEKQPILMSLVRFPLLSFSTSSIAPHPHDGMSKMNGFTNSTITTIEIPKEMDLLKTLHAGQVSPGHSININSGCGSGNLIAPQPVRPVGSSISVGCISEDPNSSSTACVKKQQPEEVEAEVESDTLPVVVSDSKNKVRLANSAFKEMVGQPECAWLVSMGANSEKLTSKGKRISGEVMLDLSNSQVPVSSNGFSCNVKVEWGRNGEKSCVCAPCNVMKLSCESKDYLFTWRIHTTDNREESSKSQP